MVTSGKVRMFKHKTGFANEPLEAAVHEQVVLYFRAHAWLFVPVLLYSFIVVKGVCDWTRKWKYVGEDPDGLAYHYTSMDVDALNSTCTPASHVHAPCYTFMFTEKNCRIAVIDLLPILPWVLSLVAVVVALGLEYLKQSGPTIYKRKFRQVWHRLVLYLTWFVLFHIIYNIKFILQGQAAGFGVRADMSDHVTVTILGISIAFYEVGWNMYDDSAFEKDSSASTFKKLFFFFQLLVAIAAWLVKGYISYYTALYFHGREESMFGILLGVFEVYIMMVMCKECGLIPIAFTWDDSAFTDGSAVPPSNAASGREPESAVGEEAQYILFM